jgi:hypothetical protein
MSQRFSQLRDFLGRYWFPTALVVLFLLAIPGIVLFVLNLLGLESDVNKWFETNLSFSYNILIPWWGALLLLLVPLLIVLLYFLKLKRRPVQVPSTFLWRKSVEDLHVNSLLQWLRQNVLLLLQILAVLFLIYGVLGPRIHGRGGEGRHYIIMIDNSASMSATDVQPSRLELAKREALKEIDAASDNDFGMVIVFNSSAQTLQSRTNNRDLLRQAVRGIQPTQRPTRIDEALSLADSLANPSRSTDDAAVRPAGETGPGRTYVQTEGTPTEVHLYSDGRFPDVPEFALGNIDLKFHSVGVGESDKQDNVGIVTMNASRDETDPSKVQIFIAVANTAITEVAVRVEIEVQSAAGGERLRYQKPLRIPGRKPREKTEAERKEEEETREQLPRPYDLPEIASVSFELKELDDRADTIIRARVLDHRDHFPLDDEAQMVLGIVRKARILIVSKGNEVLDKFFNDNLLKDVAVLDRLGPEDLDSEEKYLRPARNGDFDLVIFDRCGPKKEEQLPRGNTFFIGHPPPGWKQPGMDGDGKPVEKIANPHIKGWMSKHMLLRYLVALHEVGIAEAIKLGELPPRTPLLIESEKETPLLLTLNRQSFTDLVMTFPLLTDKDEWNTNWPLKPSFPLFLRNVLYTLGNVSDVVADESTQPGQVKLIRPDVGISEIHVTGPAGLSQTLQRGTRADFSFGLTEQVGIYNVSWNNRPQRSFAVNLLDRDESFLEPRRSVKIGTEEIKKGQARSQPRNMWKWIVLAALLLLLLEWYIYNRRVYI